MNIHLSTEMYSCEAYAKDVMYILKFTKMGENGAQQTKGMQSFKILQICTTRSGKSMCNLYRTL